MKYLVVLCLKLAAVMSSPAMLQLPGLLTPQTQDVSLQELQALQMLQAMQRINAPQPLTLGLPSATQFYIPRQPVIANIFEKSDAKYDTAQNTKTHNTVDFDSVIIDAEPNNDERGVENRKVLLVVTSPMAKQGRFGLGTIISNIPFFPIEINVIDVVTWFYNNIGSIIGAIRPPSGQSSGQEGETQLQQAQKSIILNALMKGQDATVPMMALPVNGPLLPYQNIAYRPMAPIQV